MNADEIARQKNSGVPRDLAVKIVDAVLGYTCEHSANYQQHVGWYDWAEDIIAEYGSKSILAALEQARAANADVAELCSAAHQTANERDAAITALAEAEARIAELEKERHWAGAEVMALRARLDVATEALRPTINAKARARLTDSIEAGRAMGMQWATDIEVLLKLHDKSRAALAEIDAWKTTEEAS